MRFICSIPTESMANKTVITITITIIGCEFPYNSCMSLFVLLINENL